MKREDFDAPHLVSIGLTTEHFELLEELARKSYRWLRISTIILELDKEIYLRAWGI